MAFTAALFGLVLHNRGTKRIGFRIASMATGGVGFTTCSYRWLSRWYRFGNGPPTPAENEHDTDPSSSGPPKQQVTTSNASGLTSHYTRARAVAASPGDRPLRNPITGIAGCCARYQRPRRRRSINSYHEIAPSHCVPQTRDHAKFGFQLRPSKQKFATCETGGNVQFALRKF
jgi:hypothetical protein